MERKLWL